MRQEAYRPRHGDAIAGGHHTTDDVLGASSSNTTTIETYYDVDGNEVIVVPVDGGEDEANVTDERHMTGKMQVEGGDEGEHHGQQQVEEVIVTGGGGHGGEWRHHLTAESCAEFDQHRLAPSPVVTTFVSHRHVLGSGHAPTTLLNDAELAAMPVDEALRADEERERRIGELAREFTSGWRAHWDESAAAKMLHDLQLARRTRELWLGYVNDGGSLPALAGDGDFQPAATTQKAAIVVRRVHASRRVTAVNNSAKQVAT